MLEADDIARAIVWTLEDHIAALDLLPETGRPEPMSSEMLRRRAAERERAPVRSGVFDGTFDFAA